MEAILAGTLAVPALLLFNYYMMWQRVLILDERVNKNIRNLIWKQAIFKIGLVLLLSVSIVVFNLFNLADNIIAFRINIIIIISLLFGYFLCLEIAMRRVKQ